MHTNQAHKKGAKQLTLRWILDLVYTEMLHKAFLTETLTF